MFKFTTSLSATSLARKTFTTVFVLLAISVTAQRKYHFNYHSVYETADKATAATSAETRVYDNSADPSYLLILYPNEARIKDERTDELHYFKIINEQDSIHYQYDYSLKINFATPFKMNSIQVKRFTDVDYEISYIKKNEKAELNEKIQLCLQDSEDDLLYSTVSGQNNGEMKVLLDRLKSQLPAGRKFYIADLAHHSGRYTRHYRRTSIRPVELMLTVPEKVVYKNSFLKKK